VEGWRAKPVGWGLRQTHTQMLTATQTANGAAPLPRLVTGIVAGPLPEWKLRPPPTKVNEKVDDMDENTRASGRTDSGTPATAVKITPAGASGDPVATTQTIA
jgi:hypothetical protein